MALIGLANSKSAEKHETGRGARTRTLVPCFIFFRTFLLPSFQVCGTSYVYSRQRLHLARYRQPSATRSSEPLGPGLLRLHCCTTLPFRLPPPPLHAFHHPHSLSVCVVLATSSSSPNLARPSTWGLPQIISVYFIAFLLSPGRRRQAAKIVLHKRTVLLDSLSQRGLRAPLPRFNDEALFLFS